MTDKYNDFISHQVETSNQDEYLNSMKDRLSILMATCTRQSQIKNMEKRIGKYMEANYPLITN